MTHGESIRIAHFSDTHVLSLEGVNLVKLLNKRVTGVVNLAFNRAKQYRFEVFERLLAAVKRLRPYHTICTGDLVNLALPPEFERVRDSLRATFAPNELTLVPGNHDAYCIDAVQDRLFERHFEPYLPHELSAPHGVCPPAFPVVRMLDRVGIVGLSTAIPTAPLLASGSVGPAQLRSAVNALEHPSMGNRFRVVMLHHPVVRPSARYSDLTRNLVDASAVALALGDCVAPPHLIVHGHNHRFRKHVLPGTDVPVVEVQSGSRLGRRHVAEFNVYVVRHRRLAAIERHVYSPETGDFTAHDEQRRRLKTQDARHP